MNFGQLLRTKSYEKDYMKTVFARRDLIRMAEIYDAPFKYTPVQKVKSFSLLP
jgi:hypothetical protein